MTNVHSVVCLDIDETITTANNDVLQRMVKSFEDAQIEVFINTARPQLYCDLFSGDTEQYAKKTNHKCFHGSLNMFDISGSVAKSKLHNMNEIYKEVKKQNETLDKSCVILVDDLDTNLRIVRDNGYEGIKVNPTNGITDDTLQEIQHKFDICNKKGERTRIMK